MRITTFLCRIGGGGGGVVADESKEGCVNQHQCAIIKQIFSMCLSQIMYQLAATVKGEIWGASRQ